jgi:hypothetical protein
MATSPRDVRLTPDYGHQPDALACPLSAKATSLDFRLFAREDIGRPLADRVWKNSQKGQPN